MNRVRKKSSAYISQPSSVFEITEVTSVNVVIKLLERCISFFNVVAHPSLSEVVCLTWVSPQSLTSHIQKAKLFPWPMFVWQMPIYSFSH